MLDGDYPLLSSTCWHLSPSLSQVSYYQSIRRLRLHPPVRRRHPPHHEVWPVQTKGKVRGPQDKNAGCRHTVLGFTAPELLVLWEITVTTAMKRRRRLLRMQRYWDWYLKLATSIFKRKKRNDRLVHISVIAAFCLILWNCNKFYRPFELHTASTCYCMGWPVDGVLGYPRNAYMTKIIF